MASRLAARNGGRLGLAALVAVLALGLGLRLGQAWDGRPPVYDAAAYAAIAANLERGDGFTVGPAATQPSSNYSPGLPLLVAGFYELTGGVHERAARVALALLGTLSVLFAYLIARRLSRRAIGSPPDVVDRSRRSIDRGVHRPPKASSGVGAGLVAALAVAVYPALVEYQGMVMGEPLAATLLAGAVLGMLWASDEGSGLARWLLPGALLGALTMVRPEYLGITALLALVVLVRPPWRRSLAAAALLLLGATLVVAPWTVRNAVALDRFVPVSTGGGQVLFAGTYLPSDGDPEKVGTEVVARNPGLFDPADASRLRLEQILARLAVTRYPDLESDQALARMGREQLWDDISGEPLEYAGFVATKVGRIWLHGPRQVMREPLWAALHWALIGLGLLGLALLAWRRRWEALVLATIFVAITALSALLVASPRRVLVILPLVAALAAVASGWLWDRGVRSATAAPE